MPARFSVGAERSGARGRNAGTGAGRRPAALRAALGAAIPMLIFAVAALALPLATASALALTANQLGGWIFVLFGIPAILSVG